MKFAYADPPYPGQAKRLYGDHPDYAGEVDHEALITRLERDYPDGWALSTSAAALRGVLPLCPLGARVAVWHVLNAEPPGNRSGQGWHLCWEPVICLGGKPDGRVRNVLASRAPSPQERLIAGHKPAAFSRWIFGLLGMGPDDELDDLFAGSGAVGMEWQRYKGQPEIPGIRPQMFSNGPRREMRRMERIGLLDPLPGLIHGGARWLR